MDDSQDPEGRATAPASAGLLAVIGLNGLAVIIAAVDMLRRPVGEHAPRRALLPELRPRIAQNKVAEPRCVPPRGA